jgi:hypothetical protein
MCSWLFVFFQLGEYKLGFPIWPFENDFVIVETPKDNFPLLNNYIGLDHLLNLSILDCERQCGLVPLKQEEKSFGTLKERARLWPRTIIAELQASTDWNYFAIWEEIEQRVLNYDFAHVVRRQSRQDSAMIFVTAGLNFHG